MCVWGGGGGALAVCLATGAAADRMHACSASGWPSNSSNPASKAQPQPLMSKLSLACVITALPTTRLTRQW